MLENVKIMRRPGPSREIENYKGCFRQFQPLVENSPKIRQISFGFTSGLSLWLALGQFYRSNSNLFSSNFGEMFRLLLSVDLQIFETAKCLRVASPPTIV